MEWFFGPKGLRFSEIGCRPPGVRAWDLYTVGNDIDIYREWAMAVTFGQPSQVLSPLRRRDHRPAPGATAPSPADGLDRVQQEFGEWIIDYHPARGTPTQPVEAGYICNAWIRSSTRTTTISRDARRRRPDGDGARAMSGAWPERPRTGIDERAERSNGERPKAGIDDREAC